MSVTWATTAALQAAVLQDGYAFVHGGAMREMLAPFGSLAAWEPLSASWDGLGHAPHTARAGRDRRRGRGPRPRPHPRRPAPPAPGLPVTRSTRRPASKECGERSISRTTRRSTTT